MGTKSLTASLGFNAIQMIAIVILIFVVIAGAVDRKQLHQQIEQLHQQIEQIKREAARCPCVPNRLGTKPSNVP